ncbi:MAG: GAP family protein [Propionibacteriaceae bacterium]
MGQLILDLVPLAFGIILSPLAIMALVAVLLSARARINGIMYLLGWAVAIAVGLVVSYGLLGLADHDFAAATPTWLSVIHILLGLLLVAGAVWSYRKGRATLRQMAQASTPSEVVAAAPQLPGWLRAVATFTASRSLLLGFGIFLLNPVDLSCALIAGIDVRAAALAPSTSYLVLVVFGVIGLLPIAVPVVLMLVLGERVHPLLERLRTWIGGHSGMLNAAMFLVIGVLQLQKGLSAIIG